MDPCGDSKRLLFAAMSHNCYHPVKVLSVYRTESLGAIEYLKAVLVALNGVKTLVNSEAHGYMIRAVNKI